MSLLDLQWKPLTPPPLPHPLRPPPPTPPDLIPLAGLPLPFSFFKKNKQTETHILTKKCAFASKRSRRNVVFNKLVFGEAGGEGMEGRSGYKREQMVTMLLILTLDVKLQMLIINKNIYSVLKKKFNVQREVECSFLISVGGESIFFFLCISGQS